MILNLSTIFVIIAAIIYTFQAAKLTKQNKELKQNLLVSESKILRQSLVLNKLNGELQYWKRRRNLLEKVHVSFSKKKIRGKRRKGRK